MRWTLTLIAVFLSAAAAGFLAGGCEPKPGAATGGAGEVPRVRVRLLAGVSGCTVTAEQIPAFAGDAVPNGDGTGPAAFVPVPVGDPQQLTYDGAWHWGGRTLPYRGAFTVTPAMDGGVSVNGQPYRGLYRFVPASGNTFDVINDVDVESYLRGVLAKELLADWTPEAYRAQAVIARTYALYEAKTGSPGRSFDLNPDERSQMYGGIKGESGKATAAVEQTRGQVVAYGPPGRERIFKAYFSACCGGVSSSALDVFNEADIPPLAAKSNGRTCAISPRYSWPAVTVSKAELTRRLRLWGAKNNMAEAQLPGVRTLAVATANAYGRPTAYLLTDARGQQYRLLAEQLRTAINTDAPVGSTVYSGYFTPVDAGDAIRFTNGHGFGHGVGACQWCMQARGLAGEDYRQIVLTQFPSATVVAAY